MTSIHYLCLSLQAYAFEKTYLRYKFTIDPDHKNGWMGAQASDGYAMIEGYNKQKHEWEHISTTSAIGLARDDWERLITEGYIEE